VKLPGLPAIDSRFFLLFDERAPIIEVVLADRAFSSRAFIRKNPKEEGAESCAQHTGAAKQQRKYVEQALASSGNPLFLGHRSAPVSSYSTSIIARTAVGRWPTVSHGVSLLAKNNVEQPDLSVQPWLSGNDRKQALGTRTCLVV
jgi:hypothetical protein